MMKKNSRPQATAKPVAKSRPQAVKKIVIGNWKMNPASPAEVAKWAKDYKKALPKGHKAKVVVCPPDVFLSAFAANKVAAALGVQNVSVYAEGSHTGDTSAAMLRRAGAVYAIVGHSERREAGETDEMVARKTALCLEQKLIPVVCVGESTRDDQGMYLGLLKKQLLGSLAGIPKARITEIVLAYEPVYAIGAKKALEPGDIIQMALYIKKALIDTYGPAAAACPVLYGGSVTPETSGAIMAEGGVDGLLVGRASWDAKTFCQVIATA